MAAHFDFQASTTASLKHKKKLFTAAALAAVLAIGGFGAVQMAAAEDGGLSAGVIQKVSDLPTDYATHMHEPSDTFMLGRAYIHIYAYKVEEKDYSLVSTVCPRQELRTGKQGRSNNGGS